MHSTLAEMRTLGDDGWSIFVKTDIGNPIWMQYIVLWKVYAASRILLFKVGTSQFKISPSELESIG